MTLPQCSNFRTSSLSRRLFLYPDDQNQSIQNGAIDGLGVLVPFLDKPLFDFQYPKYVAMAGVGRILAHEIGHAFDTKGRFFGELGEKTDWWSPEDSMEYDKRVMCLRDQFENFKDPSYGGRQNDSETASEMVADALGLEATWLALESIDMSNEEFVDVFLISLMGIEIIKVKVQVRRSWYPAKDFCSPTRIDTHHPRFLVDLSHPTNRFRINGAFSNLESFAKTYKCPVGSKMNPKKKCRIF
ncbi:Protein CBG24463 [Caenorhabditis briggsae]|uniref:Protein CBG24463 n=1 Tax=Caenorhabditis briggsae TaxID=6238 RepID=A8WKR9_CAEBR|nr:Protein CBG24463 [Caenorhabditis briggsae]CAP21064.1 Protein CBG24463 [Caenorhabditis briggsae]